MAWIDDVLASTAEAETPQSFVKWAALAALAAVCKKNVWLDKHMYKLYPNVYIMLIAKSGMRKGFPIYVAKELVKSVNNTRIISGRNSIQAIIQEMGRAYTIDNGGPPVTDAHAFLVSGELATLLLEDSANTAVSVLTDLYDTHYNAEWKNTLKQDKEILKNVCLTMLTASNQTLFKESIPAHAYTGGFMARTIVIHEEKRAKKNPLTRKPERSFDALELSKYLKEVAKIRGEFQWTEEGMACFEQWYEAFDPEGKDDKTGTADRLHDQILKVAMLFSLSARLDLRLEREDIERAIESCGQFSKNIEKVTGGTGKSEFASQTQLIIMELLKQGETKAYGMHRSTLLQKFWGEFTAADLDRIIDTLTQAKVVKVVPTANAGPVYQLEDQVVEYYRSQADKT